MKKLLLALAAAAVAGTAAAADYASVSVDRVKDDKSGVVAQAQYVRFGTSVSGLDVGVQARTQVWDKGGMVNSVEGTVGKGFGPVSVFGGLGHDNGFNGAAKGSFQYGLVGAVAAAPIGPVFGYAGVKTRLNWQSKTPDQTVTFAGVDYSLTKKVSVGVSASKSTQDIKETAFGLGLRVGF